MQPQSSGGFDGVWVYSSDGENLMKIEIQSTGKALSATVTSPKQMTVSQDGSVTFVGTEFGTETDPVTVEGGTLKFPNGFVMTRVDDTHASLTFAPQLRPLQFLRIPQGKTIEIGKARERPPEIQALRQELALLVKEDQDARMAFDLKRITAADAKAHPEVIRMLDQYGWITRSLAGSDASDEFWLLVQHQDGDPALLQRALTALKKAADSRDASQTNYAYLYDRVQASSGKPQHWGTQTRCINGRPVMDPVDDPAGLDARRAQLGLQPEADYLNNGYLSRACDTQAGK